MYKCNADQQSKSWICIDFTLIRIPYPAFWVNADPDMDQDSDQNSILDPNPEPWI
jgi:hypothetical protein